jgi:hypothetical protein
MRMMAARKGDAGAGSSCASVKPMKTCVQIALGLCAAIGMPIFAVPAFAESVETVGGTVRAVGETWSVDVTLRHPDTGWDHYADAWEVLAPDGTSLGVRELAHPHVDEQPFTRSLSGVVIPDGVDHVNIRARCLVDGWGTEMLRIDLPQ